MPTFTAHSAIGQREDLTDIIYDISPTETPFMSSIGKTKATAVYHEWQTDSLAAATTANAAIEGADATSATLSPTVRLGNYTQIIQKTVQVSGTLDTVNKAGRKSEKAYQLAKASAELKRDLETILLANQGRSAGSSTIARKMGSILSWIKTNSDVGSGGADPATIGVSTRTDGTQRTFTEALLKTVVSEVFVSGGSPKILMVGAAGKQKVSSFAGIAAQRYMAPGNTRAILRPPLSVRLTFICRTLARCRLFLTASCVPAMLWCLILNTQHLLTCVHSRLVIWLRPVTARTRSSWLK
jgi:hypothetical protein